MSDLTVAERIAAEAVVRSPDPMLEHLTTRQIYAAMHVGLAALSAAGWLVEPVSPIPPAPAPPASSP